MKISSKKSLKAFVAVALLSFTTAASAQSSFSVGADLVSSYIWRGIPQDGSNIIGGDGTPTASKQSPNFQPYVSFTTGAFTIGAWGSTSFTGSVKEFDLYATYAISSLFSVTVSDYNWNFSDGTEYFKYGKGTDHVYEATLAYAGTEALPLSASVNTMFAGADKNSKEDQAYSTYIELGYQLKENAKVFVGGSPIEDSAYGAGISNVGLKVTKSIAISDKFSLPVYGVAGFNTINENAFLVLGVSL